jgi:hypothetical protein
MYGPDAWMTEDLLKKIQNSDTLMKRLADPRFMAALTEFQTNPKAATEKYKDNPEMDKFLREFSGIMGKDLFLFTDRNRWTKRQNVKLQDLFLDNGSPTLLHFNLQNAQGVMPK